MNIKKWVLWMKLNKKIEKKYYIIIIIDYY